MNSRVIEPRLGRYHLPNKHLLCQPLIRRAAGIIPTSLSGEFCIKWTALDIPLTPPFLMESYSGIPVFSQAPLLPSKLLLCLLSAMCSCSAIQMWALKRATCREFKSHSTTCYRAAKCGTPQQRVTNELDCLQDNPWLSQAVNTVNNPRTHPFCFSGIKDAAGEKSMLHSK